MKASSAAVPQRWIMIALCFTATAINYIDRLNLSLAAPFMQKDLGISPKDMGLIFGAFFWTYGIMQLPMGWLVDRLGAKKLYAFASTWWSLFTASTVLGRGLVSLFGLRLLLGVGEAGAYPSNAKVTALWFSPRQRGWATAIFDSGSRVGAALSFPLVVVLIKYLGWRGAFIATGALGLIWVVVWLIYYRDPTPAEAKAIGSLAAQAPGERIGKDHLHIKWIHLFRYRTVWGMMIGFACLNFVIYFFITWFPTYLVQARGFSLAKLGYLGMLPATCAIFGGWIGGIVSDMLYRRWTVSVTRKTCLVLGMLLSSVIGIAAFVDSTWLALALLCVSYASLAFTGANVWCLPADVAPSAAYVASLGGIQSCAANLSGGVTTFLTGYLLELTKGSFVLPLAIGGGVAVLGSAAYLFLMGPIKPLTLRPERPA